MTSITQYSTEGHKMLQREKRLLQFGSTTVETQTTTRVFTIVGKGTTKSSMTTATTSRTTMHICRLATTTTNNDISGVNNDWPSNMTTLTTQTAMTASSTNTVLRTTTLTRRERHKRPNRLQDRQQWQNARQRHQPWRQGETYTFQNGMSPTTPTEIKPISPSTRPIAQYTPRLEAEQGQQRLQY